MIVSLEALLNKILFLYVINIVSSAIMKINVMFFDARNNNVGANKKS